MKCEGIKFKKFIIAFRNTNKLFFFFKEEHIIFPNPHKNLFHISYFVYLNNPFYLNYNNYLDF